MHLPFLFLVRCCNKIKKTALSVTIKINQAILGFKYQVETVLFLPENPVPL